MEAILWFALIGLAAGWLAAQFKGGGLGLAGQLAVGVVGAIVGGWLFALVGLGPTNLLGRLITATVGAILVLWLVRALGRRG